MRKVAIVGDIHGSLEPFRRVVSWLDDNWSHDIVFVGDYVNRGPDSAIVLEELSCASQRWADRLTLLLGNHDASLLQLLNGGSARDFLQHGGLLTVNSYIRHLNPLRNTSQLVDFVDRFPRHHFELLRSMTVAYETADLLISHAGFDPAEPHSRSEQRLVYGRYPELFRGYRNWPKSLVVCGHYVQRTLRPFISDRFISLDTGCGTIPGAPLTLLTLPDRNVLQFGDL